MDLTSKQKGCLLGLAIGDALGGSTEFSDPQNVPNFPNKIISPQTTIVGGGPFNLLPGQITDDTHMAVCLTHVYKEYKKYELLAAAQNYFVWVIYSQKVGFDAGTTTIGSLNLLQKFGAENAGKQFWLQNQKKPAGNGALMRIAPMAVYHTTDDYVENSMFDASITHFDPKCQLANAAYITAIRNALYHNGNPKTMIDAANNALGYANQTLKYWYKEYSNEIDKATTELHNDLEFAMKPDPNVYSNEVHMIKRMGFVRVAFRLAFWHLMHVTTYEATVLDLTNRGGDTDTNAAIAGALVGSFLGVEKIPQNWIDMVLNCNPTGLFGSLYHPRNLL